LSFLIGAPLVIFGGLLDGLSAIEWIGLIAFSAVVMVGCGILWAIYTIRWIKR